MAKSKMLIAWSKQTRGLRTARPGPPAHKVMQERYAVEQDFLVVLLEYIRFRNLDTEEAARKLLAMYATVRIEDSAVLKKGREMRNKLMEVCPAELK